MRDTSRASKLRSPATRRSTCSPPSPADEAFHGVGLGACPRAGHDRERRSGVRRFLPRGAPPLRRGRNSARLSGFLTGRGARRRLHPCGLREEHRGDRDRRAPRCNGELAAPRGPRAKGHPGGARPREFLGGFVTIASTDPLVVAREPVSPRIQIALAIPELVLRTADMRRVLPDTVPLRDAVSNVGRAATLALALSRGDVALAGRCLEDRLAEPARSPFLPGYAEARAGATAAGGSGFAMSGSGSTVFSLAAQPGIAEKVAHAMCNAFHDRDIRATPVVTSVDNRVPLGEVVPHSGPRFSIPS